jgi:hypothetical protein
LIGEQRQQPAALLSLVLPFFAPLRGGHIEPLAQIANRFGLLSDQPLALLE